MYTHYGRINAIPTQRVYRLSDTRSSSQEPPGDYSWVHTGGQEEKKCSTVAKYAVRDMKRRKTHTT